MKNIFKNNHNVNVQLRIAFSLSSLQPIDVYSWTKPSPKREYAIIATLGRRIDDRSSVYLGQILVGYGLGWTAPTLPKFKDPEQTPLPDVITDTQASHIGSVIFIGSIGGPYVTGFLSNIIGRKPCLLLGSIITALSFLILAIATNLAMVFAGRILIGLGTGIIVVVNLVYLGEIASTNLRGILLSGTGIFSSLGILTVYSIGPYVQYSVSGYIGLGWALIFTFWILFIPESPVFYVIIGQEAAANKVLRQLGREDEIAEIKIKKDVYKSDLKKELTEIFTLKSNRKGLFITLSLCIFQQMSGNIVIMFFATTIFELAGSSIEPNIATIFMGATQVFSSCITPFLVEKSGRKRLLLISTTVCCLSLTVCGIYFYLDAVEYDSITKIAWLPLVTLICYLLSYDMGLGIIPYTLIGEMFEPNIRSIGSTVTITVAWFVGFVVSTAFGYAITTLGGHFVFFFFGASCAAACIFTAIMVPETKGKTLMEIREMLSK